MKTLRALTQFIGVFISFLSSSFVLINSYILDILSHTEHTSVDISFLKEQPST